MNDYLALLGGVLCAGAGGELFVRGAVGLARWARVSAGIIGVTVAAFATSSPELSVAVQSARAGEPELSMGDVLGSNIVNIALILGIALSIAPIRCSRDTVRRDFPVALGVPVITGVLGFDGKLSHWDGTLMLGMFFAWLVVAVLEARRQRDAVCEVPAANRPVSEMLSCAGGLALLVVAGALIVAGGRGVAMAWGMDEFLVGATVVAVGTSVPELATVLVSKMRGHDAVGLGAVLGSNIFNGLFILGVAACLHPITVNWREVDSALVFGVLSVAIIWPTSEGMLPRRRGVALVMLYLVYLGVALQGNPG